MKKRLEALVEKYGKVALVTYGIVYALTLIGIAVAIQLGFRPSGAAGTTGLVAGTWLASRATLPLRILATVALTPVVSAIWKKLRPERTPPAEAPPSDGRP